ncbi:MAG: DnaJ domain-containing protein [Acinetobacter populi]|uniref:DnaJ domain-containing protein n=1 Tax=Acinetobacter populi TaxID=1582270 RepID=UPI003B5C0833|nr:DnaJ domain-containing protein [Acinetobacter populi]
MIRAAYKSLAQIYHPDKNQGDVEAARIMKLINAAYEVLSDPMKRAEHDRWIAQQEEILKNQQHQKTDHVYKQSSQNQQNTEKSQQRSNHNRNYSNGYNTSDVNPNKTSKQELNKKKSEWGVLFVIIAIFGVGAAIAIPQLASQKTNQAETYQRGTDANAAAADATAAATEAEAAADAAAMDIEAVAQLAASSMTYPTSFDCSKAKSIPEQLICTNADLAASDRELAILVQQAKSAVTDKKAFTQRIRRQWNYREKNCIDKVCVTNWFAYQKAVLTQIAQTGNVNAGATSQQLTAKALPQTGDTDNPYLQGVAPLQIKVQYGDNYWVKIDDAYTGRHLVSYFIRSGQTLNVNLPTGSYTIKYAYGKEWYGVENLFGPQTSYAKADEIFNFRFDGYQYNGYTVELIKQVNGNLQTSHLNASQF